MSLDKKEVVEPKPDIKTTLLGEDFTARLARIENIGGSSCIAVFMKKGDSYELVGILKEIGGMVLSEP